MVAFTYLGKRASFLQETSAANWVNTDLYYVLAGVASMLAMAGAPRFHACLVIVLQNENMALFFFSSTVFLFSQGCYWLSRRPYFILPPEQE